MDRLAAALGDRYTVERALGAGGMATVYLAHDIKHNRKVAVKVLRPELAALLGAERFLNEIEVTANLQHPHILPLFDSGEADGMLFYVMPYVTGGSLRDLLNREKQLSVEESIDITKAVAAALDHSHRQGVVHRDIKPENILFQDGVAVLADFGIALAVSTVDGQRLTETGLAVGTPTYMSPEQISGDRTLDKRSDVYSLGSALYEMLTGEAPYTGATAQVVMAKRLTEPVPSARRLRGSVPEGLDAALQQALAPAPADRWPTAAALAAALDVSVTAADEGARAASRHAARWRWGFGAAAFLLVASAGWWVTTSDRTGPGAGPSSLGPSNVVAVFPFAVSGADALDYLGEGMVDLLSTALDGAGDLHIIDPFTALSLARDVGGVSSPAEGRALAARLGAGRYILGSVLSTAGRLRFRAGLYGADGEIVPAEVRVSGEGEIYEAVDQLARGLVASRNQTASGRLPALAARTTDSLPALKAYLEGERSLRAARWAEAIEPLQRAVAIDSSFALAWYRTAVAALWTFQDSLARYAITRAIELSGALSARDKQLFAATRAWVIGDGLEAVRLYRNIVTSYPDDVEAWLYLGDVQWHYNPLNGLPAERSRDALERAVALDAGNREALVHLRHAAAWGERWTDYDSLAGLLLDVAPEHYEAPVTLAERAFAVGDAAARTEALERLEVVDLPLLSLSTVAVALVTNDPTRTEAVARLLTEPDRGAGVQAGGHALLAYLYAARGQVGQAMEEMAAADVLDRVTALQHRALISTLPFLAVPVEDLRQLRAQVAAWDPTREPPDPAASALFWHQGVDGALRSYLLGLLSLRLDDEEAAARYADELAATGVPPDVGSLAWDLSVDVRAQIARRGEEPEAALQRLAEARMEVPWPRMHTSPFHGRGRQRHLRCTLLAQLEQEAEAAGCFALESTNPYDLVYLAPSHLEAARMYDALGKSREAAESYNAFIDLWRDADARLRPLVDEAIGRRDELRGR
jgi:tRNA A-37 threonylcarbamoyl transferase component Bud32/tetratricopeptide (TPR) repeat protein